MPTVGTLTVDLVANTASFSGDLGKANTSLDDFGKKAEEAGGQMDYSMHEAKGSLMLVSEELELHIPRHLQALIAQIPGVGLAFAEMLPIVGVIAAIAVMEKLIVKNEEAKDKMVRGWEKFGTTSASVLNSIDDKMLDVAIKADELAGNHLNVVNEQLLKIDRATLRDISAQFEKLAGAADATFADMKTHWYEMHVGSDGAKHALDEFREKYQHLLAQGKDKEASDLLKGTLNSAQVALHTMETAGFVAKGLGEVSKEGVQSQRALVDLLNEQVTAEQKLKDVGEGQKQNVKTEEGQKDFGVQEKARAAYAKSIKELNAEIDKSDEATAKHFQDQLDNEMKAEMKAVDAKEKLAQEANRIGQAQADQQTDAAIKMAQTQFKIEEENAKHMVAMHKETAAEAAQQDIAAVQKEMAAEKSALVARLDMLDAYGKDKEKKEQEINNKIAEINQQGAAKIKQIQDQSQLQQIQALTQAEDRMGAVVAETAAKSILENKNMGQALARVGAQMVEKALENALQLETIQGRQKLSNAKTAYGDAYAWAAPAGPIAGAIAGSLAFASVMAFAGGGEVPGVGSEDSVRAALTPGETVVTKSLTEQVKNSRGGSGSHFHFAPTIQAVDSDGVSDMLDKHEAVFTAKMHSILRKNHKG